jgi:solute:Na+ symporter, SSS family
VANSALLLTAAIPTLNTRLVWQDWLAILGYIVLALGVGTYMARRASRSTDDFYLAGRKLPWWIAGTSLVATSFAADTPLVITGWVRTAGISQNWLWWGMASGSVLSFVMLAGWWRRLEVTTDAELIERRYGGTQAKMLRGFFGTYHALVTNTIVLVWVLVAMNKVVRVVLDIPAVSADGVALNYDAYIVAAGVVLALTYSFMSGFWGVVVTDFFQFFLALGGAVLLSWKAISELGGMEGAREAFAGLGKSVTDFVPARKLAEDGTALPWLTSAAWALGGFGAFMIFVGFQGWFNKNSDGGGPAVQRFSSCLDENHARKASLWYHIAHYALRPWPWIAVALASLILIKVGDLPLIEVKGKMEPDHEAAYPMMMALYLGPGLFGLMCASFLAAFMSTLDTHFNLASAYLVNDTYRRFLVKDKGPRHYVWVGRFVEIGIGLIAGFLAVEAASINDLFVFSLSLLGGLGPALLLRWFWWRANAWTEISALATSTLATFVVDLPYPLSYLVIVSLSLVVMVTVTLLTKPVERKHLQAFHDKVRPVGWWKPLAKVGQPKHGWAVFLGWAGGVCLIYSLIFLPGAWLLGRPMAPYAITALVGAGLLRWSWPRTMA